jgi:arsenite methyltransferase
MKKYLSSKFNPDNMVSVLDEVPLWSAPFGLKLLDFVKYRVNLTVADIGSGTGFPSLEIAMRLGEGSTVYAIEPWKEARTRILEKIISYRLTNIRILEEIAESMPLEDHTVDLITSNNGINNVQDMEKVFGECSRIIKPGGQFIQTFNLAGSMIEFYRVMESVLTDMKLDREVEKMHMHIAQKRPSVEKILSMLQNNGFIVNDLVYDEFSYKFSSGTAMLNHYFIRLAFMDSWINILPESQAEKVFDEIEVRLNKTAEKDGFLKLSIPFALINALKG